MPEIDLSTITAIDAEVKRIGTEVKAQIDTLQTETKGLREVIDANAGKVDTVVEERITKFAASVETKQAALEHGIEGLTAAVDQVKTALNRTGGGWKEENDAQDAAYQFTLAKMANAGRLVPGVKPEVDVKAIAEYNGIFGSYLRRDEKGLNRDAQAALQTGSDPDGGYLVPVEVSQRIITKIFETSPIRQLATVETISGKELELVRDEGEFGYGWVGEQASRPETTTSQIGLSKITAHEMYAAPKATQNMLEDAGIDVEMWISNKIADKFGRVEATGFVAGTGVGQPRGLLTYPSGTANGQIEQVTTGVTADFGFDGIINLMYTLKDPYAANADFLMNRLGVRNVARLKDSQGRYLWEPSRQKGEPALLMGHSVYRAADIAAPASGALAMIFGDIKTAYTVVDRLGITTLRDPYTAKPYVIFYSRRRVGGDVVNFEALKIGVCA